VRQLLIAFTKNTRMATPMRNAPTVEIMLYASKRPPRSYV
jgi:hypothetical protein